MSILYDPHTRRPQLWVIPFFIAIAVALVLGVFLYGQSKSDKLPSDVEKNTVFEGEEN